MSSTGSTQSRIEGYALFAIATVMLFAAWGNREIPGAPMGIQLVHVLAGLAVFMTTILFLTEQQIGIRQLRDVRTPLLWAVGLIVAFILSSGVSLTPSASMKATLTFLAGLCLAAAVNLVASGRTTHVYEKSLRSPGYVGVAAAISLGSLAVTIPVLLKGPPEAARLGGAVILDRPVGAFQDPNELGSYCALSFFIAASWFFATRSRIHRVAALAATISAGCALLLSMSRGAWIAAIVGIIVMMIVLPTARKVVAWSGVAITIVTICSAFVLPAGGPLGIVVNRATTVFSPSSNPYDVRPLTWNEALREFRESPLLGNGPGSFRVTSATSPSIIQFYPRRHAHNGVLTILAENGVVGIICLAGLVVAMLYAVGRSVRALKASSAEEMTPIRPSSQLAILAGGTSALAALATHLAVDYPLRNPFLLIAVWTVIGLTLACCTSELHNTQQVGVERDSTQRTS